MGRTFLPSRRRPGRSCGLALLLLAAGALAGCTEMLTGRAESEPFYYYAGQRIALRVDDSRLTVALDPAVGEPRIGQVLAANGIVVDSVRALWMEDHYVVHLPAGRSPAAVERAARALRLADGVAFASAVYDTGEAACPLLLVDRLAVQFGASATAAEISALNAAKGVRDEQVGLMGTRSYRYPLRLSETPLELAASYYRNALVDWAQPDWISCMRTQ